MFICHPYLQRTKKMHKKCAEDDDTKNSIQEKYENIMNNIIMSKCFWSSDIAEQKIRTSEICLGDRCPD
jgi:hypothetical protein